MEMQAPMDLADKKNTGRKMTFPELPFTGKIDEDN